MYAWRGEKFPNAHCNNGLGAGGGGWGLGAPECEFHAERLRDQRLRKTRFAGASS